MISVRFLVLLFMAFIFVVPAAQAQNQQAPGGPELPPPLDALAQEGAQIRYLGRELGLDGWIAFKGGQEQYFYATPDGRALLLGVLFDQNGKMITVRQVRALQEQSGDVLDSFAVDDLEAAAAERDADPQFKTPGQQLYEDVTNSNWVALGDAQAPHIYMFVDPQCPHCHEFTSSLKERFIDAGLLQVRLVPVGLTPERKAQAAFLLAAPNPGRRWFRHIAGDEKALPVSQGVNEQGVERNVAIMQSWGLDVTPLTVYETAAGEVKIVTGTAADPSVILRELIQAGGSGRIAPQAPSSPASSASPFVPQSLPPALQGR